MLLTKKREREKKRKRKKKEIDVMACKKCWGKTELKPFIFGELKNGFSILLSMIQTSWKSNG